MTRQVPIRINAANALRWLGTLYRNPADAIKEHVSNAIDEHLKALARGAAVESCQVVFTLGRKNITIEYPYGMDPHEFQSALQRVADSAKKQAAFDQIGQMGIGIFGFQQIGRRCDFFSKRAVGQPTVHVTLREGADAADFRGALKRDALHRPGIKIVISDLKFDPTKPRGPLAPEKLTKIFAEKFDGYLRKGWLRVDVKSDSRTYAVTPMKMDLPRLGKGLDVLRLPGRPADTVLLNLYFDPSGRGTVGIRHAGVVVVEDLKNLAAYGLEESIYAAGHVRGFIDADFLQPLPARTGFEEDARWIAFLDLLDRQCPQIEAEVTELVQREREKALSQIQRRALELARDILDAEEFNDLELLGGLAKRRKAIQGLHRLPTGRRTGERSKTAGDRRSPHGLRVSYVERPFESGPALHSRFVGGEIQANELNPDFVREMQGLPEAQLAYAALMIGKETISYNDKSGGVDDYLEKLLGYYFRLKATIAPRAGMAGKRGGARPRKPPPLPPQVP